LSGWGDYNRTAIAGIDWEEIELGGSNPKVRFSVLYNQTLTKGRVSCFSLKYTPINRVQCFILFV